MNTPSVPLADNHGIPNLDFVDQENNIMRGGQPATDGAWNFLKSQGITRILKLNQWEDEGGDEPAEALGIEVVYMPIDLTEQFLPNGLDKKFIESCVGSIIPNSFIHCGSIHRTQDTDLAMPEKGGVDRTGLVCCCYRVWKQGWPAQEAMIEMDSFGFHKILFGLYWFIRENVMRTNL